MLDILGTPYSGLNLSLSEGALISPADGQVLISLKEDHKPTLGYVRRLRRLLAQQYPDTTFFFLAPDISTQVLNFGLPAPIDVQVVGAPGDDDRAYAVAQEIADKVRAIPGAVDVHLAQVVRQPELRIDVDRTMASGFGLKQQDVANDILVSLSSSTMVQPNYWLDTKHSVQYLVAVQTPQYDNNSIGALSTTPLSLGAGATPQLLSNVAEISRTVGPANVTHYNSVRTYDVQANVDGADLGLSLERSERVVADDEAPPTARGRNANQGPDREHGLVVPRPGLRAGFRGASGLPADGRQLPVLARPLRHLDGPARARSRASPGCSSSAGPRSACRRSWAPSCAWGWPPPTASL